MEGGEGASMLRSGGRHSRQRTVSAKVLWWPGPAGLMVLCDLCGHTGPQAQKRPVLGLMLCCCHLDILNQFLKRDLTFSFYSGLRKSYS